MRCSKSNDNLFRNKKFYYTYARFGFQNCKSDKKNNEIRTENGMTFKMLQNLRTEPDLMVLCETEV